jgi:hypothetical protein
MAGGEARFQRPNTTFVMPDLARPAIRFSSGRYGNHTHRAALP